MGGKRHYSFGRAYSTLTGYFSKTYGTMGVEKAFNSQLVSSKSGAGDTKKGCDITLTTNSDLQQVSYQAISNISNGAAVVLDVQSGEILAMASTPSFIPSELEENWSELVKVDGLFLPNAYRSTFAPGSDFKIISACAVIDNNVDGETVEDEGSYTFKSGHVITNYKERAYGELDLDAAIEYSSNVYFITKALEMGGEKLEASIRKFMVGESVQLDFGNLPSSINFGDYSDEMVGSIAFGQGTTEVTPLHMAMAAQAIANDGKMLKPYLIKKIVNGSGKTEQEGQTETLATCTSRETARRVNRAMTQAARHYELPYVGNDWELAAKTGTAETGTGSKNGWIVSFAPANDPKYAVVVMAANQDHDGIYYKNSLTDIYSALAVYDANRS